MDIEIVKQAMKDNRLQTPHIDWLVSEFERLNAISVVLADVCTMCVESKRGPSRIRQVDGCQPYLELVDGSGIGTYESTLWLKGRESGLWRALELAEGDVSPSGGGLSTWEEIADAIKEEIAESV